MRKRVLGELGTGNRDCMAILLGWERECIIVID